MGRLGAALATAIAIGFGVLTLWGLIGGTGSIQGITNLLLQLTVISVAVTILLGILNLFSVHLRRITQRQRGWVYSIALIGSAAVVIVLWVLGQQSTNAMLLDTVELVNRRWRAGGVRAGTARTAHTTEIRQWLLAVPVSAGARGILLGIALATVVTGVRVLIGQDRSYRE
ncbi:MAG: hypothetical protein LC121_17870 [Anaerolineae bacterium]|nr:hypothetical protein [Anaerolineae bacterium]